MNCSIYSTWVCDLSVADCYDLSVGSELISGWRLAEYCGDYDAGDYWSIDGA